MAPCAAFYLLAPQMSNHRDLLLDQPKANLRLGYLVVLNLVFLFWVEDEDWRCG
jgi:hypothetical protein